MASTPFAIAVLIPPNPALRAQGLINNSVAPPVPARSPLPAIKIAGNKAPNIVVLTILKIFFISDF